MKYLVWADKLYGMRIYLHKAVQRLEKSAHGFLKTTRCFQVKCCCLTRLSEWWCSPLDNGGWGISSLKMAVVFTSSKASEKDSTRRFFSSPLKERPDHQILTKAAERRPCAPHLHSALLWESLVYNRAQHHTASTWSVATHPAKPWIGHNHHQVLQISAQDVTFGPSAIWNELLRDFWSKACHL